MRKHILCEGSVLSVDDYKNAVEEVGSKFLSLVSGTYRFSFSVLLASSEKIRSMNKKYRGANRPTNILSFADRVCYEKKCYERGCEQINRGTEPLSFCLLNDDSEKLNNGELYIGDLIISLEVLCEEASNLEIEFNDYLARILVHGIAHLLGFSHKNRVFEEQMIKFESNMLCQIGLKNIAEIL